MSATDRPRISGGKFDIQALAEDLAQAALEWVDDALEEGAFGVPYSTEFDDEDARYLAQDLIDRVLDRYWDQAS